MTQQEAIAKIEEESTKFMLNLCTAIRKARKNK